MSTERILGRIAVKIDPERIPEPCPCPLCAGPTDKQMFEYFFPSELEPLIKNDYPAPGYSCQDRGAELFDGSTTLVLDQAMIPVLMEMGEITFASSLADRIRSLTYYQLINKIPQNCKISVKI